MDHYGTLVGALDYHQLRGNEAWADSNKTDEQRTAALVRASAALDGLYGAQFGGVKAGGRMQVLAWPRDGAHDNCADELIPSDEVPTGVINAAYEFALAELAEPGSLAPSITLGRLTRREKVEGIEREFFGSDDGASAESMRPALMVAEDALRCLLGAPKPKASGSVFLLRY